VRRGIKIRITIKIKKGGKVFAKVAPDFGLAGFLSGRVEVAEETNDFRRLQMDAFNFVIGATPFDGGPVDDGSAAWDGVAHVGLLEDLFETRTRPAVGKELNWREIGVTGAIDNIEEPLFDGVGDGDAEIQVPR